MESLLLTLLNFLCILPITMPEQLGGSLPNFEFDFDALPGTQHDFKIFVKGGKEECFVQKVAQGANLHVQFEVIRIIFLSTNSYIKNIDRAELNSKVLQCVIWSVLHCYRKMFRALG